MLFMFCNYWLTNNQFLNNKLNNKSNNKFNNIFNIYNTLFYECIRSYTFW